MKSYQDLRFEIEAAYRQVKWLLNIERSQPKMHSAEFDLLLIINQLKRGAGVAMQRMRSRSINTLRLYLAPCIIK